MLSQGSVRLSGCAFASVSARDGSGGAVYARLLASVSDSTFTDAAAATGGGAVFSAGAAVVQDSRFLRTAASAGDGGAIFAAGGGGADGAATVTRCSFTQTASAQGSGGAVAAGGAVVVQQSTFNSVSARVVRAFLISSFLSVLPLS